MHIKRCFMTKNSFVAEVTFFNIDIWYAIFLKKIDRFSRKFLWICICLVRQNSIKKSILKECIQSYFLHGSISCLGIYMSVSKPSICFWKSLFQISEGTSCLFTTWIWQFIERVHVVYSSWFSWRYGPLPYPFWHSVLALEDPGFSQGLLPPWSQSVFVKLCIKVYFWML